MPHRDDVLYDSNTAEGISRPMPELTSIIAIVSGLLGVVISALSTWLTASKKKNITLKLKAGGPEVTINSEKFSAGDLDKLVSLLKNTEEKAPNGSPSSKK